MGKIKIFTFDTLCLGLRDAARYLNGQTYCFPWNTGVGYGLFADRQGRAFLVKHDAWDGAWGELWEVTPGAFERVSARQADLGMVPTKILLPGGGQASSWILPPEKQKGARLVRIKEIRKA